MKRHLTLRSFIVLLSFLVFCLPFSIGQTTIWSLDFETAGGYTTSVAEFNAGTGDYFIRTDGYDIDAVLTNSSSYFFAAQDINGGDNITLPVSIDNINIQNYTNIELRIDIAEDDDGTNEDWDDADYFHVKYDIDNSGIPTNLLWIENDGSQYNSAPFLDTDFDATGDGTEITNTFSQFTKTIPETGNLMDLTIEFYLDSGDEDIAIDNIELVGTLATNNDNTSLVNADGVTQPGAANISSLTNDPLEAVHVFQFNIKDAGTTDDLPTKISSITFKAGPNNTADWTNDIADLYIIKSGASFPIVFDTPLVTPSSVTFPVNEGELEIADGTSQLVDLYIWIDSTTIDNIVIEGMIDADAHGFIADPSGSVFASDFTTDVVSNQFTIEVVATDLSFVTQPTDVLVNQTQPAVLVAATDANGNVDTDNAGTDVTLAYSGAGALSGTTTVTTTAGIAEFTDLSYDAEEAGVNLTATGGTLNGAVSEAFDVVVINLPYTEDFTDDLGFISTFSVSGDTKEWVNAFGTVAQMYGNNSGELEEDWLILPAIDFSSYDNAIMTFETWYISGTDDADNYLKLYYSADYDGIGSPADATWTELDFNISSSESSWASSGAINLSMLNSSATIAFKYHYNADMYRQWHIDDILIEEVFSPIIQNVVFNPEIPLGSDPVSVTADITDDGLVDSAFLVWCPNDALPADWDTIAMVITSGDVYTTVMDIPAQDVDTVFVHIFAVDDEAGVSEYTDFYTILPTPSLYEIQFTQADPANSPFEGMVVRTTGIVTANDTTGTDDGFFFQDSASTWNGIYVHDFNENDVKRGDSIVIMAEVDEYFNLTELKNIVSIEIIASGKDLPSPLVIAPGEVAEPYEGVLVQLQDVKVTATRDEVGFGQFGITDGTDTILVDDDMIRADVVKDSVYTLTGIITYSFGEYKLLPRDITDIDGYIKVNMAPEIKSITISPVEPTEDDAVVLSFTVTDDGEDPIPADAVSVMYGTVEGTYDMEAVITVDGFDATKFSATIPQMAPGMVYYKITAADTDSENPLTAEVKGSYEVDVVIGITSYTTGTIEIFPNPNKGEFILEISQVAEGAVNLSVLDVQGRIVETQVLHHAAGETFRSNIMLQNADKGLYILLLENDGNKYHKRLIVE